MDRVQLWSALLTNSTHHEEPSFCGGYHLCRVLHLSRRAPERHRHASRRPDRLRV